MSLPVCRAPGVAREPRADRAPLAVSVLTDRSLLLSTQLTWLNVHLFQWLFSASITACASWH